MGVEIKVCLPLFPSGKSVSLVGSWTLSIVGNNIFLAQPTFKKSSKLNVALSYYLVLKVQYILSLFNLKIFNFSTLLFFVLKFKTMNHIISYCN